MASLGFRPPQFSEDLAWLPAWLQHPQPETSADHIKESQNNSDPSCKDLEHLQQIIGEAKNVEMLSSEENRYKSCHLFFSGEDNSPNIIASSPRNVLHLCLHLSSNGDSQYSQTRLLYASKLLHGSSNVMLSQEVKTSAGSGENTYPLRKDPNGSAVNFSQLTSIPTAIENAKPQSPKKCEDKIDYNARVVHLSPPTSKPAMMENVGPLSPPTSCKNSGRRDKKMSNVRDVKDDIDDAVELSVAASEALVMHELMKTELASDVLPIGSILEAALQVKGARLEFLEDALSCPSDEIDEIDSLSDLDDSSMVNALLDVGLAFSGPDDQYVCGSDISKVDDTPGLSNHYYYARGSERANFMDQQDKICDDSELSLDTSSVACHDPVLYQPAEEVPHLLTVAQPQGDKNVSCAGISENAYKECHLVANRFRSRWLGGWTVEEVDTSAKLKQNGAVSIPKFLVPETSYLSESADIALDENSFANKHEAQSKIASQSSVPFQGLCDNGDGWNLISQSQEAISSDQSLVDPLCSVVPCSLSIKDSGAPLAHNWNDGKVDAEKCIGYKSEPEMEYFLRTSYPNVVPVHGQAGMTVPGKCCGAGDQMQLASMKAYSTVLPNHAATFEDRRLYCNGQSPSEYAFELISSDHIIGCIKSSDQKSSKLFPSRSVFEGNVGSHDEDNPAAETMNHERNYDEPAKVGAEPQVQTREQRRSPLILNRRKHYCLQSSEHLIKSLTGEKNTLKDVDDRAHLKSYQGQKRKYYSNHCESPQTIARKQVRFAEGSKTGANKKLKYVNPWSYSQIQGSKSCFREHFKDSRRLIFDGIEFLLTGFSNQRERYIVGLIQKYGGVVLLDIPSTLSNGRPKRISRSGFQQLPVIISSKKLQTTKFLYGCAINALILRVKWLTDSITAGSVVPPEKYMILNQANQTCRKIGKFVYDDSRGIFDQVGIMLHGKHTFCTKLAIIIKHGGGQVFKTLQRLFQSLDTKKISLGAIVAENQSRVLRHLRHCASERKIPMMPASWIAKSLHLGKLLPFEEKDDTHLTIKVQASTDWSQEI